MKSKLLLLTLLLLLFSQEGFSQLFGVQKKETIIEQELKHHFEMGEFNHAPIQLFGDLKDIKTDKDKYLKLNIQPQIIERIIENKYKFISIQIPFSENSFKTVLLKKRELFSEDFKLIEQNANGKTEKQLPNYIAYSGVVNNEVENTLVSISFVNNTLRGIISIGNKEYTIGPKNNKDAVSEYVLFEKNEVQFDLPEFACGTEDTYLDNQNHNKSINQQTTIPKCVTVHFEMSYPLVESFGGSSQSISNFINLFNNVQTVYNNENITLRVSYLVLWLAQDPYHSTETKGFVYYYFGNETGPFNGNIGCLLGSFAGGGASTLGSNGINSRRYNVCGGIVNTSTNFPNYSWEIMVVSHEMGHSLGSSHTHWCGWVGGALDNCYNTEGGCPQGVAPVNGGTIMSYCHLTSNGINLNNGFGLQPGNVIRNEVLNYSEFVSCQTAIVCEDNVVSNVQVNDNGQNYLLSWTSSYPVKIYRRENFTGNFDFVNSFSTSSATFNYINDCNIEKSEFKLVSVCPNGDSKPTVVVIEPKGKMPNLNYSGNLNLCTNYSGDQLTLNIQNSSYFNSFQWKFNGNIVLGANSSSYTISQLGNYTCSVSNTLGCTYESPIVTILEDSPFANFKVEKSGLQANFTYINPCANQVTWDFGDGTFASGSNPTHNYLNAGDYIICQTVTNLAGTNQSCKTIKIFANWIDNMNNTTDGNGFNITYDSSLCAIGTKFTKNSPSDYLQNSYLQYNSNDWIPKQGTVEFLVKITNGYTKTNPTNNYALLFSLGNGLSDTKQTEIRANTNGSVSFKRYNEVTDTYTAYSSTTPFTYNQWHVISLSYGSQGTKLAVDGVVYQNQNWVNWDMNDGVLNVGEVFYANQNNWLGFEGIIDKFRISPLQNDFQLTTNNTITPTFTQIAPVCKNAILSPLPTVSNEGITGTWLPALNNLTTTTYTFTPDSGQCASNKTMTITVNITPAPNLSSINSCSGLTVGIVANSGLNPITFYSVASGGLSLPSSTLLNTGTYYISQTNNGCESARKPLIITINSATMPTAAAAQSFCAGATVSNLSASGTLLKWYDVASDGVVLSYTTVLTSGIYYVSQTLNSCESSRTAVNVTVNATAQPTGNNNQSFIQGQTIADIVVSGSNIVWYTSLANATNNINPMPNTTPLINGNTYYAIQTQNGCRSSALAVTVSVILNNVIFEANDFLVYPNPFNDKIIISSSEEIQSVRMFDLLGRKLREENRIYAKEFIFNIDNLQEVVYILEITTDKATKIVKLVKK